MKITVHETDLLGNTRIFEADTDKYYYDCVGNEYWYDKQGNRHYTRNEG